jgi:hypothetical protein
VVGLWVATLTVHPELPVEIELEASPKVRVPSPIGPLDPRRASVRLCEGGPRTVSSAALKTSPHTVIGNAISGRSTDARPSNGRLTAWVRRRFLGGNTRDASGFGWTLERCATSAVGARGTVTVLRDLSQPSIKSPNEAGPQGLVSSGGGVRPKVGVGAKGQGRKVLF